MASLKDRDVANKVLDKSGAINTEFGREKGHLSTTKIGRKKKKDKVTKYSEEIDGVKNIENE